MDVTYPRYCRSLREYIAVDNPHEAQALDESFFEKAQQLIEQNTIVRLDCVNDTRELVAHQNYIIIYDVVLYLICFLWVLYAARQWPPSKKD